MNKMLCAAAAVLFAGTAAPSSGAVFTIDRTIGSASVKGTITTDDTIGVLSAQNITDYALSLRDANGASVIKKADRDSFLAVTGDAFTATSSGLFFDFSATGRNEIFFANQAQNLVFYCIQTGGCFDFNGGGEAVRADPNTTNRLIVRQTGIVQLTATGAVPEPATWAMMITGFGLVGGTMRRRRTSVAFA